MWEKVTLLTHGGKKLLLCGLLNSKIILLLFLTDNIIFFRKSIYWRYLRIEFFFYNYLIFLINSNKRKPWVVRYIIWCADTNLCRTHIEIDPTQIISQSFNFLTIFISFCKKFAYSNINKNLINLYEYLK